LAFTVVTDERRRNRQPADRFRPEARRRHPLPAAWLVPVTTQASTSPPSSSAAPFPAPDWPVIRRYDADHLRRIALPVGGIGTGTISFTGSGALRDVEIANRPAKGFVPD